MINKTVALNLCIILQGLLSTGVIAAPQKTIDFCNKQQSSNINYSQCLDHIKETVDRELQTWVNNQVFVLEEAALISGRKSALDMFKRSQSNFITFRENNCRWQYLVKSPSTDASTTYKKCYILVSNDRIKELSQLN